jgi:hypothetical protein
MPKTKTTERVAKTKQKNREGSKNKAKKHTERVEKTDRLEKKIF